MTDNTYTALAALAGLGNPLPTATLNSIIANQAYFYTPPQAIYTRPLASINYTVSTTEADIDGTNMAPTIITTGAPMICRLVAGRIGTSSAGSITRFFLLIDGVSQTDEGGPNGVAEYGMGATADRLPVNLSIPIFNLAAGSHTFKWRWITSAGTATLYSANLIQSWFREG